MKPDAALIRRYDSHGPRYTSYPTAVQFHTGVDEQSPEQIEQCMVQARALGYRSVSFDLIYGLPLQTVESFGDCDLIGLGVSAIGAVGDSYSQNRKDLSSYYAALDQGRLPVDRGIALSVDDVLRREVIQRLMCKGTLSMREIERRYALDFSS